LVAFFAVAMIALLLFVLLTVDPFFEFLAAFEKW
jgi:hypothetical protein